MAIFPRTGEWNLSVQPPPPLKRHPLRPKEGFVLVCEGEEDMEFLQRIWINTLPPELIISIYHANGHDKVATLADVLSPSVYIVDRDFKEAQDTLNSMTPYTHWPRQDMESYLLYSDWLVPAVETINNALPLSIRLVNSQVRLQKI